jgi:hypothetical protein
MVATKEYDVKPSVETLFVNKMKIQQVYTLLADIKLSKPKELEVYKKMKFVK